MMKLRILTGGVIAAGLALQAAAGLAAGESKLQAASGTVVAVTEGSKTIVIQSTLEGKPWIVGAEVADDTEFEGKAKELKDLKPGDTVTMRWVRQEHGALARSITVR